MMYGTTIGKLTLGGQVDTPEAIIIAYCLNTIELSADKISCIDHVHAS